MKSSISLVFLVFISLLFFYTNKTNALTSNNTLTITAVVSNNNAVIPNNGGAGGAGGGGAATQKEISNSVVFKGLAYPGSTVILLKDSQIVARVPASPSAVFEISLSGVDSGTYNFGIRAQDSNGGSSPIQVFTIVVTSGVATFIDGILLPPSIALDKSEIRRGDVLTLFGKSIPKAQVSIVVNSEIALIKKTVADLSGGWVFKLDTLELEYGNHQAKARGKTDTDITPFSNTLSFKVGETTKITNPIKSIPVEYDVNKDQKINILDFSIMAYWYRKDNPPVNVDLNNDGKVNLSDFSVLAYYWTG